MPQQVVVPDVGEGGMEVVFVSWLKSEGDRVEVGEPIFEVDTEKALFQVEAFAAGRLFDLRASEGDSLAPQEPIALLLSDEEWERRGEFKGSPQPAAQTISSSELAGTDRSDDVRHEGSDRRRMAASPRARRLAERLGIDLAELRGSGPDELITEDDVRRYGDAGADPRRDKVRQAVAQRTLSAWQSIPHFTLALDADVSDTLRDGKPFPLLCLALAQALEDHPECNIEWSKDELRPRSQIDLGILVETEHGLLLPRISDAASLSLPDLEAALAGAVKRARSGKLSPDDSKSRSASVSNLGMFSVDRFIGVIASPDVLLLTVGRLRTEPRPDSSGWVARRILPLALSVDHRALDGADAGRLLTTLERILGAGTDD